MADSLQPELPTRSPQVSEGLSNRQGIVLPPDNVDSAEDAMDDLFKSQMGRDPTTLDDTPDRDRDKLTDAEINTASEIPELDQPSDDPIKNSDENQTSEDPKIVTEPTEAKSFLDDLLPDDAVIPTEIESNDLVDGAEKTSEEKEEEPDPYESQKLRSDASERTKETFEKLKHTARERENTAKQEVSELKGTLTELQAELATFREQSSNLPDDIKSELEELRAFRLVHDMEHDTDNDSTFKQFKQKFDTRLESNENIIYDILKKGGLQNEVLDQLKGLPYEDRVNHITRWADKLSPREKLLINSRLGDNESVEVERKQAILETKANASKLLAERKVPSTEEQNQTYLNEVVSTLKPVLTQVPIIQIQEASPTATPKEKESIDAHNVKAAQYQSQLLSLLQDQTPATKGVLALAGILAPHYRSQLQASQAQLKTVQAELSKIKNAGKLSRLSTNSAPSNGSGVGPLMEMGADEALDEMWKSMNPTN